MKKQKIQLIGLTILVFSQLLFANENNIAKVVIMKGQVTAKLKDGTDIEVKVDQSFPEGVSLQTAQKSFVKLIFIDKSQMNLGPNSHLVINAFPKAEAGIITLVKGQIRSQVTKDYMEMDDKNKSKLYIKTKTAAMGIRGTDFQVNFNADNQNTSLITFEGKVAMSHIDKNQREDQFDQGKLEKFVSSEKAVMVEHGQISAVNLNVAERAMAPTLLGTKQIEALKNNESGTKESTDGDKKQYRNALPPGADSSIFSNVSKDSNQAKDSSANSDSNGFFNSKTGEYKLPAGSIIDLNTVNIIPPPANAVFDPNTKTYVVPENFGKIDKSSGEYLPPTGLKLGTDGKFILIDPSAYAKSQIINKEDKKEDKKENKPSANAQDPSQSPEADNKGSTKNDPSELSGGLKIEIPKVYGATPEAAAFANNFSQTNRQPAPSMTDAQRAVAAERITTTETVRQTNTNMGTTSPTSKVKIIFNVQ